MHDHFSLHAATLEEEIKEKLQECFDSLNLSKFVHYGRVLEDAINFIKLLKTVLPSPEQSNINSQSICWNISINLMLHSNDTVIGNINSHRIHININSDPSFTDPRIYFADMLKGILKQGVHKKRLCIPRVFLAGFPKSGSTSLDRMLTYHPKIEHGLSKEPKWWIPSRVHPNNHILQPTIEYFVKYVLQYKEFGGSKSEEDTLLLLDSSPNLLAEWVSMQKEENGNETYEGVCLIPTALSVLLQRPQFIVILRDPIQQLYSDFWYSCSTRNYNLTGDQALLGPGVFHRMVNERLEKFESCSQRSSVEECVLEQALIVDKHSDDFPCGEVPLGMPVYYVHVKKWFSLFPRSSFFFIAGEDFFASPLKVGEKVWDFLGVSKPPKVKYWVTNHDWVSKGENSQVSFDYHHDVHLQMSTWTRIKLKIFFKRFNKKLVQLLNDKTHSWSHSWQER